MYVLAQRGREVRQSYPGLPRSQPEPVAVTATAAALGLEVFWVEGDSHGRRWVNAAGEVVPYRKSALEEQGERLDYVRKARNQAVNDTLWAVASSSPLTPECAAAYRAYHEELNRLTLDYPDGVVASWPVAPPLAYAPVAPPS